MSSLPSGVRLVRLLNEHLNDIMNRERANQNSIHLYSVCAVMASMELLIAMFHNVYANSLALIRKERKLSLATSVTVVPFQLSKMVNV